MSQQPLRELVVIEDGTIAGMAADARFVTEFPFLKNLLIAAAASCSSCNGGKKDSRAEALKSARRSLAGLSSSRLVVLKRLLNARKVRLIYRDDAAGKAVKLTF